ncbi:MAG: 6-carboxyhexanoate--CoA ligase, partial [Desulfovibrio sp.]|nr:6-carboxyhexanoate--CoA ligase [Desulfovibrio sp.]
MGQKFSIKMRASAHFGKQEKHISGAERIVEFASVGDVAKDLIVRAQTHSLGLPDSINVKIEALDENQILTIPALRVSAIHVENANEGLEKAFALLAKVGVKGSEQLATLVRTMRGMRGAMLVHAYSLNRLDDLGLRGVRATFMDKIDQGYVAHKDHYSEALVLATKVAHCPAIIAELCISDDPNYVTGYVASKQFGYVRIAKMKRVGDRFGGRIFFVTDPSQLPTVINYLEHQPVLVTNIQPAPDFGQKASEKKWQRMREVLEQRAQAGLLRNPEVLGASGSGWVAIGDEKFCQLSSNDYLGLTTDKRVIAAQIAAAEEFGSGSGGARLTTGTRKLHRTLERALANFKKAEDCVLFNTGYMANLGIIQALCNKDSIILSDSLNHASIIDGCRLSKAEVIVYKHNDLNDLEAKAKVLSGKFGLIISDAVFSMDGDILNLPRFLGIAQKYGFFSMIDEAHSTGVLGQHGIGLTEYFGLKKGADITVGTLSKALASEGGFVTGSKLLCDYLRNTARSFIFSTALAPATVADGLTALLIIKNEPS